MSVAYSIAWRAKDHPEREACRQHIAGLGYQVAPIIDRQYVYAACLIGAI